MKTKSFSGRFESLDGKATEAQLQLEVLSLKDRGYVAMKKLAIGWALALVFVPVPGAHFVAVPGLFIGGIVAAFLGFGTKQRLADIRGQCPLCGEKLEIAQMAHRPRIKEHCPKCRANLYLVT